MSHSRSAGADAVLAHHPRAYPATGGQLFLTRQQGRINLAEHSGDGKCFARHAGKVAGAGCGHCRC